MPQAAPEISGPKNSILGGTAGCFSIGEFGRMEVFGVRFAPERGVARATRDIGRSYPLSIVGFGEDLKPDPYGQSSAFG